MFFPSVTCFQRRILREMASNPSFVNSTYPKNIATGICILIIVVIFIFATVIAILAVCHKCQRGGDVWDLKYWSSCLQCLDGGHLERCWELLRISTEVAACTSNWANTASFQILSNSLVTNPTIRHYIAWATGRVVKRTINKYIINILCVFACRVYLSVLFLFHLELPS